MQRRILQQLLLWKKDKYRKPLVLRGARQVGKTWVLKEFGHTAFDKLVYVNFEETPSLQNLFELDFDIDRIIAALQIHARKTITASDTLIVFDEIQSAEKGITSLKYFCENAPEYHVIAAGSLLGMGLHSSISFPVGKVDFMELHPMSFAEFLIALDEEQLANALESRQWSVLSTFSEKLKVYLRYYMYVGGMPEVVAAFAETKDWLLVRRIQNRIVESYENDFPKHAPTDIVPRIKMVWDSIPSQLAKENKKFVYGAIKTGARAKDFEMAIQWLIECGLLLKLPRISKYGKPLRAYLDLSAFKLFLHDVGLLGALAGLDARTIIDGDKIFEEFKGAIAEQYVMQQLKLKSDRILGYWTNDRSTAEIDFLVQDEDEVIPLEVKSGINTKAKSFKQFCDEHQPKTAIRASLLDYHEEDWLTNVPLYAIGSGFFGDI
ncbi:MAG: ATP-binding protein [Mangrovibacterium sp.]